MGWTAQRKTGQRICRLDEAIRAAKAAKENTLVDLHIICKDSFFFLNCRCNSAKSPREPRDPFSGVILLPASRESFFQG